MLDDYPATLRFWGSPVGDSLPLFAAGLPEFACNFSRDSIYAALITGDLPMLEAQLRFCALLQGRRADPETGEEPGKIHHEYPGVRLRGRSTLYNACDSTSLFLIGCSVIARVRPLSAELLKSAEKGYQYLLRHMPAGLFLELPGECGAERFALRVTYWKDSELPARRGGAPSYPVVYTLAHFAAARAVAAFAEITGSTEARRAALRALEAQEHLWDERRGNFVIALDADGAVTGVSTDSLHALYFLRRGEISESRVNRIASSAKVLETAIGYRTLAAELVPAAARSYHARAVWPFEQAVIAIAAAKHSIPEVAAVAARISEVLAEPHELFEEHEGQWRPAGCNLQLWSAAASRYFAHHSACEV